MNLKDLIEALDATEQAEFQSNTEWELVHLDKPGAYVLANYADYGPASFDVDIQIPFSVKENEDGDLFAVVYAPSAAVRPYIDGDHAGNADITDYIDGTLRDEPAEVKIKNTYAPDIDGILNQIFETAIGKQFERFYGDSFELYLSRIIVDVCTDSGDTYGRNFPDYIKDITNVAVMYPNGILN
jgi:hypothetical protein